MLTELPHSCATHRRSRPKRSSKKVRGKQLKYRDNEGYLRRDYFRSLKRSFYCLNKFLLLLNKLNYINCTFKNAPLFGFCNFLLFAPFDFSFCVVLTLRTHFFCCFSQKFSCATSISFFYAYSFYGHKIWQKFSIAPSARPHQYPMVCHLLGQL